MIDKQSERPPVSLDVQHKIRLIVEKQAPFSPETKQERDRTLTEIGSNKSRGVGDVGDEE